MSKRNVAFTKPEEPSFLKKLKAQAGYQEGPTIDTKREELGSIDDRDFEDNDEEEPTVVVLKSGDLTAEEVAAEKIKLKKEAASAPADLKQRIIFKAPNKKGSDNQKKSKEKDTCKPNKKSTKKVSDNRLLSFDNEEDDE